MKGTRSKVKGEPGTFHPDPGGNARTNRVVARGGRPKIRAVYFTRRREHFDEPVSRALTPEELMAIAAIKKQTPDLTLHRHEANGPSSGNPSATGKSRKPS